MQPQAKSPPPPPPKRTTGVRNLSYTSFCGWHRNTGAATTSTNESGKKGNLFGAYPLQCRRRRIALNSSTPTGSNREAYDSCAAKSTQRTQSNHLIQYEFAASNRKWPRVAKVVPRSCKMYEPFRRLNRSNQVIGFELGFGRCSIVWLSLCLLFFSISVAFATIERRHNGKAVDFATSIDPMQQRAPETAASQWDTQSNDLHSVDKLSGSDYQSSRSGSMSYANSKHRTVLHPQRRRKHAPVDSSSIRSADAAITGTLKRVLEPEQQKTRPRQVNRLLRAKFRSDLFRPEVGARGSIASESSLARDMGGVAGGSKSGEAALKQIRDQSGADSNSTKRLNGSYASKATGRSYMRMGLSKRLQWMRPNGFNELGGGGNDDDDGADSESDADDIDEDEFETIRKELSDDFEDSLKRARLIGGGGAELTLASGIGSKGIGRAELHSSNGEPPNRVLEQVQHLPRRLSSSTAQSMSGGGGGSESKLSRSRDYFGPVQEPNANDEANDDDEENDDEDEPIATATSGKCWD